MSITINNFLNNRIITAASGSGISNISIIKQLKIYLQLSCILKVKL